MRVLATAFNSTRAQTSDHPHVTAWGLSLRPGMRAIAVSRDLESLGLVCGVRVRIDGLDGTWEVRDRMPAFRRRAIDVYMGDDIKAARRFGRRHVRLHWSPDDRVADCAP